MNKKYFLAVDIGNTITTIVILKDQKVMDSYRVASTLSFEKYKKELSKIFKKFSGISRTMTCSVVPFLTEVVTKYLEKQFKIKSDVIGRDIKVPIKNNYDHPSEVGQDRLVCAYAAKVLYGAPCLVIDLGTAITIDVVSAKGTYEGGMIIPGIRLSLLSLNEHTALLPKVNIKIPQALIGKNTKESMLSGVFFGYGAMLSGLIDMMTQRLRTSPNIIVTGGYTDLMKKFFLHKKPVIDKELIFKGMALLSSK